MSPENAKVFIAEDDHDWQQYEKEAVTAAGHQVVIEVDSLEKALTAIPQAKELGVDVALVDGTLYAGNRQDGTRLTEALHETIPGIKVVDVSGIGTVKGADAKMDKVSFDIKKLGKMITDF